MSYIPPFTVSAEAINLIAEISAQIERYAIRLEQEDGLRLRKANRIKTIHSSLAIEGNTLSEEEVRDVIDGKNVVAPIRQIQEVKNAIKTYELYPTLDAFKEKDLLKAHGVMMQALVDNAGHYRRGGVGVFGEKGLVHLAPPADRVPMLMGDLFDWLKRSKDHLLIRSCVFHFEFEFIHPFIDGNGRMGRLWQSLILGKLHPLFEHLLKEHQGSPLPNTEDEFDAKFGKEFGVKFGVKFGVNERKVLLLLASNPSLSAENIAEQIGLTKRGVEKQLKKFRDLGIITRKGSDKTGYWEIVKEENV